MSDLVPVNNEQVQVTLTVPAEFKAQMQGLADLLNAAIADDGLYQQGVNYLSAIDEMTQTIVESAVVLVNAAVKERDEALENEATLIDDRDALQEQLNELEAEIESWEFSSDARIRDLVQEVQESFWEVMDESSYDTAQEGLMDNATEYIQDATDCAYSDARAFASAIMENDINWDDGMWDSEAFKRVLKALYEKFHKPE